MPWGMEYNPENFGQDVYPSPYQSSLTDFPPGLGNVQTPALSRYQEYLSSAPRREDYTGGFWNNLLAGIAGASRGYKDPAAGINTALQIQDNPYQQALQEYRNIEPGLRQAAGIEEKQLGEKMTYLRMLNQNRQDQTKRDQELKLEEMKLNNSFEIAKMNASNDTQRNLIIDQHNKALEALQSSYNSIRSQDNMYDFMKAFSPMNILRGIGSTARPPSAEMLKFGINQQMLANPLFRNVMGPKGADVSQMNEEQFSVYNQMLRDRGLPANEITPGMVPEEDNSWWPF